MIPATVMTALITKIQNDTSVVLIKYDQNQATYPFGTYRSSSCSVESAYKSIRSSAEKADDPTTIVQTRFEKYQDTYSFNFFDTQSLENARSIAMNVFYWFDFPDNRSFCKELFLIPRLTATVIQDRSTYKDSAWLYQVGFDMRLDYTNEVILEIEKISKIQIEENFGNHTENLEVEV
ncbi:phage neck terminator protein [Leptospira saintgironsiae]|uniref:Phage neck terminator protein gp12-like domain-containing protein n=1 Tax=Leptospira saintgironsiae TaxID=2023183 RepID=A0A2M9YCC7_9LEPT|nr:hypothetical protein [Leptospira saintgironsiae]PJZ49211.1 hypothetical protein CH362_07660 [Leptospira saintgironsiae]